MAHNNESEIRDGLNELKVEADRGTDLAGELDSLKGQEKTPEALKPAEVLLSEKECRNALGLEGKEKISKNIVRKAHSKKISEGRKLRNTHIHPEILEEKERELDKARDVLYGIIARKKVLELDKKVENTFDEADLVEDKGKPAIQEVDPLNNPQKEVSSLEVEKGENQNETIKVERDNLIEAQVGFGIKRKALYAGIEKLDPVNREAFEERNALDFQEIERLGSVVMALFKSKKYGQAALLVKNAEGIINRLNIELEGFNEDAHYPLPMDMEVREAPELERLKKDLMHKQRDYEIADTYVRMWGGKFAQQVGASKANAKKYRDIKVEEKKVLKREIVELEKAIADLEKNPTSIKAEPVASDVQKSLDNLKSDLVELDGQLDKRMSRGDRVRLELEKVKVLEKLTKLQEQRSVAQSAVGVEDPQLGVEALAGAGTLAETVEGSLGETIPVFESPELKKEFTKNNEIYARFRMFLREAINKNPNASEEDFLEFLEAHKEGLGPDDIKLEKRYVAEYVKAQKAVHGLVEKHKNDEDEINIKNLVEELVGGEIPNYVDADIIVKEGAGMIEIQVDADTFSYLVNKNKKNFTSDQEVEINEKIVSIATKGKGKHNNVNVIIISKDQQSVRDGRFTVEQLEEHERAHIEWKLRKSAEDSGHQEQFLTPEELEGLKEESFQLYLLAVQNNALYKAQDEIIASFYSRPLEKISRKFNIDATNTYDYYKEIKDSNSYKRHTKEEREMAEKILKEDYLAIIGKAIRAFDDLVNVGNYELDEAVALMTNRFVPLDEWPAKIDELLAVEPSRANEIRFSALVVDGKEANAAKSFLEKQIPYANVAVDNLKGKKGKEGKLKEYEARQKCLNRSWDELLERSDYQADGTIRNASEWEKFSDPLLLEKEVRKQRYEDFVAKVNSTVAYCGERAQNIADRQVKIKVKVGKEPNRLLAEDYFAQQRDKYVKYQEKVLDKKSAFIAKEGVLEWINKEEAVLQSKLEKLENVYKAVDAKLIEAGEKIELRPDQIKPYKFEILPDSTTGKNKLSLEGPVGTQPQRQELLGKIIDVRKQQDKVVKSLRKDAMDDESLEIIVAGSLAHLELPKEIKKDVESYLLEAAKAYKKKPEVKVKKQPKRVGGGTESPEEVEEKPEKPEKPEKSESKKAPGFFGRTKEEFVTAGGDAKDIIVDTYNAATHPIKTAKSVAGKVGEELGEFGQAVAEVAVETAGAFEPEEDIKRRERKERQAAKEKNVRKNQAIKKPILSEDEEDVIPRIDAQTALDLEDKLKDLETPQTGDADNEPEESEEVKNNRRKTEYIRRLKEIERDRKMEQEKQDRELEKEAEKESKNGWWQGVKKWFGFEKKAEVQKPEIENKEEGGGGMPYDFEEDNSRKIEGVEVSEILDFLRLPADEKSPKNIRDALKKHYKGINEGNVYEESDELVARIARLWEELESWSDNEQLEVIAKKFGLENN